MMACMLILLRLCALPAVLHLDKYLAYSQKAELHRTTISSLSGSPSDVD
jgi:hypothetical protein